MRMGAQLGYVIGFLSLATTALAADLLTLPSPAGENSSLSRLTVDNAGTLHLSWVETTDKQSSLYRAEFLDERWSAAQLLQTGNNWFVNWADFPALAVNHGNMTAHWLQKTSAGTYNYDINAVFYSKSADKWSDPVTIHKDGVSAEHGFVSMLPLDKERTLISWLDGRNTGSGGAEHGHGGGAMTLRAGVFAADGTTESDVQLDGLVCDCCQTSSAMTDTGPVVVYRNRTDTEIRDIYITRQTQAGWSEPVPVHNDNWQIAGCPVNGPAVASYNGLTAVAWFTAVNDLPKVQLALSHDGGVNFTTPITVASGTTNGRVSISIIDSGSVVVSWLEITGKKASIQMAAYSSEGIHQYTIAVAETSASRRSGFPVIANVGDDVYITWTDVSDTPKVKVARVRLPIN